jgi:phenylpyruvate tautomerase PptA (4-oxalocrotonate tautomerase family)
MPIIEIQALPPPTPLDVPQALSTVTKRVAAFLQEEPRGTWAVFRPILPEHFAEGDDTPRIQPKVTHPALARVFANRPPEQIPELLRVVGEAVVDAFGLEKGNVFVRFEPADENRLWWGE